MKGERNRNRVVDIVPILFAIGSWLYLSIDAWRSGIAEKYFGISFASYVILNLGIRTLFFLLCVSFFFRTMHLVEDKGLGRDSLIPCATVAVILAIFRGDMNAVIHYGVTGVFYLSEFWASLFMVEYYFILRRIALGARPKIWD